jgi:predicted N-formylglutamate amidohydrolase
MDRTVTLGDAQAPFEQQLLGDIDPATVTLRPNLDWLIVCDHASNHIAAPLAGLGLNDRDARDHIAWDIGAAKVATIIAERLDAPSILCNHSRLVIDCNRYPDADDAAPAVSDEVRIPGNGALTAAQRRERVERIAHPYHRTIAAHLDHAIAAGRTPIFLSIHSCTSTMGGRFRPWHIGLAHARDLRFTGPLLDILRRQTDVPIGDNQPYDMELGGDFTTPEHAMTRGLAHMQVEFRNDLIADEDGVRHYADLLATAIETVAADTAVMADCRTIRHYLRADDPVRYSYAPRPATF